MKKLYTKYFAALFVVAALASGCCCEKTKTCAKPCAETQAAPSAPACEEKGALVGAYSEWISPVPADALAVFSVATKDTEFAALAPARVSSQVVAGTNYKFDCGEKIITIFEPLPCNGGAPKISGVEDAGK